jgi:putative ABC transport system permease protein
VRNWEEYVRRHLSLPHATRERESHIVRDLAAQLEDIYRDAVGCGLSEAEADEFTRRQIPDWHGFSAAIRKADRTNVKTYLERLEQRTQVAAVRGNRRWNMFAGLIQDVRFGLRQWRRNPGFTAIAVLTLVLGIGATATICSVVDSVLLRPLPYEEPDRIVAIWEASPGRSLSRQLASLPNYADWAVRQRFCEAFAAWRTSGANLTGGDRAERIAVAQVTSEFFRVFGVVPSLGRSFTAAETAPGGPPIVILSDSLWRQRFAGDPNVLGRTVALNGDAFTIVGVLPRGFKYPGETDVWTPLRDDPAGAGRRNMSFRVAGRLAQAQTLAAAQADMNRISRELAAEYPEANGGWTADVVSLHEETVGTLRPPLVALIAAAGFVLLIACANVANMLLARGTDRQREVAIRMGLGAGGGRLLRQMVIEGVLLAVVAAVLGLVLANMGVDLVAAFWPEGAPRGGEITLHAPAALFTVAISVIAGITFGLFPALQLGRCHLHDALRQTGRSATGLKARGLRNALVVGQVALALTLLVGATLLIRSLDSLIEVDPGFESKDLLTTRIYLPETGYTDASAVNGFFQRLLARLRSTPGVTAAALNHVVPLSGDDQFVSVTDVGRPFLDAQGNFRRIHFRRIDPSYTEMMQIPLIRGRRFSETDRAGTHATVLINETAARRYWPNEDPVGRSIQLSFGRSFPRTIVGIVGDVRHSTLEAEPTAEVYVPLDQDPFPARSMGVMIRTMAEPDSMAGSLEAIVREMDADLVAYRVRSMDGLIADSLSDRRFTVLLLGLFSIIALLLAVAGIYGTLAYVVSRRTSEIGIRMALGAQPGNVFRHVIGEGLFLVVSGLIVGLGASWAVSHVLSRLLFGISPTDAVSFTAAPLVMIAAALVACYVPARRAMRVDPIEALRQE